MKRKWMTRKISRENDDKKMFDREFWKNAGHETRFAAAWEMVRESFLFKGITDVGEQGLQRSVQHIQRRKS